MTTSSLPDHLDALGTELDAAWARRYGSAGRRRQSQRRRIALGAGIAVAGLLAGAAWSGQLRYWWGSSPQSFRNSLNTRYTSCIEANGATYTLIPRSGGVFRVDIPALAREQCGGLDLAREAVTGPRSAPVAAWLAAFPTVPLGFWRCVDGRGFRTLGGTGRRTDYWSLTFRVVARSCALQAGVNLPAGPR